jgi:hypothetical protein
VLHQQHVGSLTAADEFHPRERAAIDFQRVGYLYSARLDDLGQFFSAVDEDSAHEFGPLTNLIETIGGRAA